MQKLCASGQWDHLVHDHVSNNCKNGEHHVVYRRNHSRVERVQSLQSNKRVKRHNKDYAEEFKHRFVYVFCFILVINLKFWFFHLETWIVCYLRPWEKKVLFMVGWQSSKLKWCIYLSVSQGMTTYSLCPRI